MANIISQTLTCYDYTDPLNPVILETPHTPGSHNNGCMVCLTIKSDDGTVTEEYNVGAALSNEQATSTIEALKKRVDDEASGVNKLPVDQNNWYQ